MPVAVQRAAGELHQQRAAAASCGTPPKLANINRDAVPYAMAMHLSYVCVAAEQLHLQFILGAKALYVSVAV